MTDRPTVSKGLKTLAPATKLDSNSSSSSAGTKGSRSIPFGVQPTKSKAGTIKGGLNRVGSGGGVKKLKNALPSSALLPSKMPLTQGSGRDDLHTSSGPGKKLESHLDDVYDRYLLNFVTAGLLQELGELQESCHRDELISKMTEIPVTTRKVQKVFADKLANEKYSDLKQVEVIRPAFGNLIDFKGEESLMGMQNILAEKFDKIVVSGAKVEDDTPLFEETELTELTQKLNSYVKKDHHGQRNQMMENDVLSQCLKLTDLHNTLVEKEKAFQNRDDKLKSGNLELLETLSLMISEEYCQNLKSGTEIAEIYQNSEDGTEEESPAERDLKGRHREAARPEQIEFVSGVEVNRGWQDGADGEVQERDGFFTKSDKNLIEELLK